MSDGLQAQVESLPKGPGVYLFKDARGAILYVGKAQNLRSRVRQYVSGGDGRVRIPALMKRTEEVSVLVTPTVKDALLLENELIKQHKPAFNVRLRDDKQYLGLRIDPADEWPRLSTVRRLREDSAQYFGPYTSSVALRRALSDLRKIFPLRSCTEPVFRDYARRGRPCIEYEMKRCVAPCVGRVEPEPYAELVAGTLLFLQGKTGKLLTELKSLMDAASRAEEFEEAARLRNRIAAVESTTERQQIVGEKALNRDVFGLARSGGEVGVQVLRVRDGRVVGAEDYGFTSVRLEDVGVMTSFLGQYYSGSGGREIPKELLVPTAIDDADVLEAVLGDRLGRKVSVRQPRRGPAYDLVKLANANAEVGLARRIEARSSIDAALKEVEERCGLRSVPRRIECYDVSTLQGTLAVASRVVFEDGKPLKNEYRRYRIQEAMGGDDYDCLREVMRRRLARVEQEPLPDLLLVDGGRGQLGVVVTVFGDADVPVECMGIAKERDLDGDTPRVKRSGGLKAERLFRPGRANPVMLSPSSKGLLLLQRVRDESHRFAITFQRDLRSRMTLASILEELPGIGPAKRRALLKHLGSLKAVKTASEQALREVPGISERDAATVRGFFRALEQQSTQQGSASGLPSSE